MVNIIKVPVHGIKIKVQVGALCPGGVKLGELAGLYLTIKAIEGDIIAREILDAFEKVIKDANGKIIYPVKEKKRHDKPI